MTRISDALIKIQSELKAPKGLYNAFGKYKYRSCENILEAVKPLLKEVGAVLTLTDEIEQKGDRFYVKATATLVKENESIQVSGWAREAAIKKGMDEAQITGACSTYARKYALNGLFAIDDSKDDPDGKDNRDSKRETLLGKLKELNIDIQILCDYYNVSRIDDIDENKLEEIISKKEAKIKKEVLNENRIL